MATHSSDERGMEDYTFAEARKFVAGIEEDLQELGIHPYSVRDISGEFTCYETGSGQYVGSKLEYEVDVEHEKVVVGQHRVGHPSNWDYPNFAMLRCGLLDELPEDWRERIAYWQWLEPGKWREERQAWRKQREVRVNAAQRDDECARLAAHAQLKRRFEEIEKNARALLVSASTSVRPAKRQRTDAEVLEERAKSSVAALPDGDDADI